MRKTAVITGAASGFGAALARLLGGQGWDLALVDRPGQAVGAGGQPEPLVAEFDVRDAAGWERLQADLRDRWPRLDLLVNAAGVGASGEVGLLPADQWRRVVDTNLIGTALGCETFLPWLRAHPERSSLVNVSSIAGLIAPPTMAAYAASKAGVIALSETIAAECSPGRPAVTIVCPGFFRSGLLTTWHFSSEREVREAQRRMLATRLDGDALARRVRRAIERGERYVVEGPQARWLWRLKRLAPRSTAVLLNRIYRRIR